MFIKIEIALQHNWERAVLLNSGLQQDHQAIKCQVLHKANILKMLAQAPPTSCLHMHKPALVIQ